MIKVASVFGSKAWTRLPHPHTCWPVPPHDGQKGGRGDFGHTSLTQLYGEESEWTLLYSISTHITLRISNALHVQFVWNSGTSGTTSILSWPGCWIGNWEKDNLRLHRGYGAIFVCGNMRVCAGAHARVCVIGDRIKSFLSHARVYLFHSSRWTCQE